jgi:RNA polymerase-interacting CarD/CdnL/TRCF family regulator
LSLLGLFALLVAFLVRRGESGLVGYLIDKNAGFKNLVSSALTVSSEAGEVSSTVVSRACTALHGQHPHKLLPLKLIWAGRYLYIPVLVVLGALFIPQVDLLNRKLVQDRKAAEAVSVQKGALKLAGAMSALESKLSSTNSIDNAAITKNLDMLVQDLKGVSKNEALLKLGEFENTYKKEFSAQRNFEQAAKGLQATPDMNGLAPESRKQLKKLLDDFKTGDFKSAAESLRELAKQMQSKSLSADEKKDLARELAKLCDSMKGQGLSEELSKMLRQMESSSTSQDELLKQCQQAGSELNELAKFCEQADGMKAMKDGLKEAKKEMLGDCFSDFDAKEVEKNMEAEANGGCAGLGVEGQEGDGSGSGDGTGGHGKGRGGLPLENMSATNFKNEMSPSKLNKGKILQQLFVSGVPEKGEAVAEYSDVVESARKQAASSLAKDKIPREYESLVKSYFDSLDTKRETQDRHELETF